MKHVIIVVCFNDTEMVKRFVSHTVTLDLVDKIILVDNCSTNGLSDELRRYLNVTGNMEIVDLIQTEENKGYAYGNNFGIKYAEETYSPEYISISNSDVILNNDAISASINFLKVNKNVGFVTPRMLTNRTVSSTTSWKQPTYTDIILNNLFLKSISRTKDIEDRSEKPVDVIIGSYFMGKNKTFEIIDYFDERTFLYYEENIIGYRIKKAGLQNYVLGYVNYFHDHSSSINTNIESVSRRMKINYNSCKVYLKYYLGASVVLMVGYKLTALFGRVIYTLYCFGKNIIKMII